MDLLLTAVADVALLIATARALRTPAAPTAAAVPDVRGRRRLRDELRRAAAAYLKALLRNEESMAEPDALAACRVAAEHRMPRAIATGDALCGLMTHESGALEGFASARHDLWRLARLAISMRDTAASREGSDRDVKTLRKSARQVAKRLRKALVAYVRAAVRSDGTTGVAIAEARRAALDELGMSRGLASARAPGELPGHAERFVGEGVARALRDLVADWSDAGASVARVGPVHLSRPMVSLDMTFAPILRRLARRTEREIQGAA